MSPADRIANSCDNLGRVLHFSDSYAYAPEVLLGGNPGPAVPRLVKRFQGSIKWTDPTDYSGGVSTGMASPIRKCDEAISSLRVADNWMRKATMLRARGMYHLVDGNRNEAIRDFRDARQIVADAGDPSELRLGFITTINLLLSAAYDGHINRHEVQDSIHTWLLEATKAYPYSDQLQALVIRRLSPSYLSSPESESYRQQVATLSPRLLNEVADIEEWLGSAQNAYDMHQTLTRSASQVTPVRRELILSHAKSAALAARMSRFTVANDHIKKASQLLELYSAAYQKERAQNPRGYIGVHAEGIQREIDNYERLVKGYQLNEADNEARLLHYLQENSTFPNIGSTFHLFKAIEDKWSLKFTNTTDLNTVFVRSRLNLEKIDMKALVQQIGELAPVIVDIQQQSGMTPAFPVFNIKHSGYKVTELGEGRLEVEYTREGAAAAQVQELALLKAAMIATEEGKAGFYVEDEQNYRFIKNTTQSGMTLSSDTVGFRSKIIVRLIEKIDPSTEFGMAVSLNASRVVADLSAKYL